MSISTTLLQLDNARTQAKILGVAHLSSSTRDLLDSIRDFFT